MADDPPVSEIVEDAHATAAESKSTAAADREVIEAMNESIRDGRDQMERSAHDIEATRALLEKSKRKLVGD